MEGTIRGGATRQVAVAAAVARTLLDREFLKDELGEDVAETDHAWECYGLATRRSRLAEMPRVKAAAQKVQGRGITPVPKFGDDGAEGAEDRRGADSGASCTRPSSSCTS